jgi:hypothetical protein
MTTTETGEPMPSEVSLYGVMSDTLGDIIGGVAAAEQMAAAALGWRTRMIEQAASWAELVAVEGGRSAGWDAATTARRTVSSEIATALHVPERDAVNMVETAKALVRHLPDTLDALGHGSISYRHAERIAEHSFTLPDEAKPEFDRVLAEVAPELTAAQTNDRARRLREHLHPASITERRRAAIENRCVTVDTAQDGMAWLSAYLPGEQAIAIHSRLTDLALDIRRGQARNAQDFPAQGSLVQGSPASLAHGPYDPRTLAQLRADALADLLIAGEVPTPDAGLSGAVRPGTAWRRGVRAKVLVTVPVLTLLGSEDIPGTLEGYGPIAPDVARELAASAPSFIRILTHPETGAVLSIGRDRYAVPADLRAWLRARDETCRFPGCGTRAEHCDIDHTIAWQHRGPTSADNLAHLCRSHHALKHNTAWTVIQTSDGVLQWRSPTGRSYLTRPQLGPPGQP